MDARAHRVRPGLLIAAALAATAVALPAPARAATLSEPLRACYLSIGPTPAERQVVRIDAAGFAPNARVDVLIDGVAADTTGDGIADEVYADAEGRVIGKVRAPYQAHRTREFAISLTERDNPANTLTATAKVSALGVRLHPSQAPPSRRVRFRGRGFTAHRAVWAHYLFRDKVRRTVRLARRSRGDCGWFSARRRQIPIARPRTGRWTLQIDQQRHYADRPDSVFVRLDIKVERVVRRG